MAISTRSPFQRIAVAGFAAAIAASGLVAVAASPVMAAETWTSAQTIFNVDSSYPRAREPSISDDGDAVAYGQNNGGGAYQPAYVAEATAGMVSDEGTMISAPTDYTSPYISGDGTAVAWADGPGGGKGNKKGSDGWDEADTQGFLEAGDNMDSITMPAAPDSVVFRNANAGNIATVPWNSNGSFGTVVPLESGAYSPEISSDGSTIAYTLDGNGVDNVNVIRRDGDGWGAPTVISDGVIDTQAILGMSADGNVIVWKEDSGNEFIFGSSYQNGAWLSAPIQLSTVKGEVGDASVAADGSLAFGSPDDDLVQVRQFRDGTWLPQAEITSSGGNPTISDNGNKVSWQTSSNVQVRSFVDGAWADPIVIADFASSARSMEMSANGQAVTWVDGSDLYYAHVIEPGQVRTARAVAGVESATVTFTHAPEGTSPTTSYVVRPWLNNAVVDGRTCTLPAPFTEPLTCNFVGLTAGASYTFKVHAVNSSGDGDSVMTNAVVPTGQDNPAIGVRMEFINVPANVVVGQQVRWFLEVDYATRTTARPTGNADVFLRGAYQCTAPISNGSGSCLGAITSLGELKLTSKFTGDGGTAGAEAAAQTTTHAATVSIAGAKVSLINAGVCRATATLAGRTTNKNATVTVQRKAGSKWTAVGSTRSSGAKKWKLRNVGLTGRSTKFRVTDGKTTNAPVVVKLKSGLQTRGC